MMGEEMGEFGQTVSMSAGRWAIRGDGGQGRNVAGGGGIFLIIGGK